MIKIGARPKNVATFCPWVPCNETNAVLIVFDLLNQVSFASYLAPDSRG